MVVIPSPTPIIYFFVKPADSLSFDDKDEVVSLITRTSIDTLSKSAMRIILFAQRRYKQLTLAETNFRDQVELSDWAMIKKMKVEQGVQ